MSLQAIESRYTHRQRRQILRHAVPFWFAREAEPLAPPLRRLQPERPVGELERGLNVVVGGWLSCAGISGGPSTYRLPAASHHGYDAMNSADWNTMSRYDSSTRRSGRARYTSSAR